MSGQLIGGWPTNDGRGPLWRLGRAERVWQAGFYLRGKHLLHAEYRGDDGIPPHVVRTYERWGTIFLRAREMNPHYTAEYETEISVYPSSFFDAIPHLVPHPKPHSAFSNWKGYGVFDPLHPAEGPLVPAKLFQAFMDAWVDLHPALPMPEAWADAYIARCAREHLRDTAQPPR